MIEDRRRSTARPALHRRVGVVLAGIVLLLSIAPVAGARERSVSAPPAAAALAADLPEGLLPTIHYEDALAHADDVIEFEPGGRVTRGFAPRAGDTLEVGGDAPRPLPPGRATGADMAGSPQGSTWAPRGPTSPLDGPTVDPALVVDATSSSAPITDGPVTAAGTGLRREVFGFLPYWEVSDGANVLNYDVLSTIAYFSVGADTAGNLLKQNGDGSTTTGWGGWTSSKLTTLIDAAHAKGTRVVLTISMFAWTDGQATKQAALLGNPAARQNLARQAAAAVRDRGADGINLDFEPIVSTYGDEFTALVREVRAELDAIAPGYQLTFDTTGYIGNYPIEAATAPGGADAIFVMGYDYRGSSSSPVGSISPLTGPTYDLTDTVKAYTARVPASKLILGVPYYGRAWSTDSDQPHAGNISGTKHGTSVTAIYTTAAQLAAENGRRWDATDQSPWTAYRRETCTSTYGCATNWRQLWYDDAESLRLRYDLVNAYGLRGAGIWALGYDDARTELNQALADKFLYAPTLQRYAGSDRYATAAAISAAHYAPGVAVAYVATGANFPDALAGAAVAGNLGGPLLLVTQASIPSATLAELGRLQPNKIVVLGSAGVVGDGVAEALRPYTTSGVVERYAGSDRYATAAAISAAHYAPGVAVAYVATGANFPDALAGAAVAGNLGGPVLLVTQASIPSATLAELGRLQPNKIVVLGSAGVVGDGVAEALRPYTTSGVVERYAGSDRYATAAAISAAHYAPGVAVAYVATGANFPDALAGAAVAGNLGGPLLLVTQASIPSATLAELSRLKPARIVVLGSAAVVSDAVLNALGPAAIRG